MRFVNDVVGQVQLLIVYGNHQVVKSSGDMWKKEKMPGWTFCKGQELFLN
jgi:hypothetical protein